MFILFENFQQGSMSEGGNNTTIVQFIAALLIISFLTWHIYNVFWQWKVDFAKKTSSMYIFKITITQKSSRCRALGGQQKQDHNRIYQHLQKDIRSMQSCTSIASEYKSRTKKGIGVMILYDDVHLVQSLSKKSESVHHYCRLVYKVKILSPLSRNLLLLQKQEVKIWI